MAQRHFFDKKIAFTDLFKEKTVEKIFTWSIVRDPGPGSFIHRARINPPILYKADNLNELLEREKFISCLNGKMKLISFMLRTDGTLIFARESTAIFALTGKPYIPNEEYSCITTGGAYFDENNRCSSIFVYHDDELDQTIDPQSLYFALKAFVENKVPLADQVCVYMRNESITFSKEEISDAYRVNEPASQMQPHKA